MKENHNRALLYQILRKDQEKDALSGVPIFYLFKYKRGKKLAEHMVINTILINKQWFFKGFCQQLNPKYCILMDCGTIPDNDAINKLYWAMETEVNLGGVCGYMKA